ncbi:hypothetical protein DL546_002208 [Coniochaeta pulveracea]|uniref:BZIP transcription factor n=1 Tax=Coniochaeta pulveracea TaxID=177199 RepID=A0A420XYA3_9PEZI|nr:hypothetical protein DL546_002208 [Coniochaeta pulveracea]
MMDDQRPRGPPSERSNSSSSSGLDEHQDGQTSIHAPVPLRPRLPSRKSSGTIIVPRDYVEAGPLDRRADPDDVRCMSPRRSVEDLANLGNEARDELRRHAKALQDSLANILGRIEAVRSEHDKLDNNNKFLQKYIGDLMATSKITATSSRGKK